MKWPDGTYKSTQNAFDWQSEVRDSIFAQEYQNCTSLYNQWRTDKPKESWPEFRDRKTPKAGNFYASHLNAKEGGFRKNGGTVYGLSEKADEILRVRKLMPLAGNKLTKGKFTAPHGGAYSKARAK